jgi:hypothetical protein
MFQQMPITNSPIKLNKQAIGISIPKLHFHSFWIEMRKQKKEAKKELIMYTITIAKEIPAVPSCSLSITTTWYYFEKLSQNGTS